MFATIKNLALGVGISGSVIVMGTGTDVQTAVEDTVACGVAVQTCFIDLAEVLDDPMADHATACTDMAVCADMGHDVADAVGL